MTKDLRGSQVQVGGVTLALGIPKSAGSIILGRRQDREHWLSLWWPGTREDRQARDKNHTIQSYTLVNCSSQLSPTSEDPIKLWPHQWLMGSEPSGSNHCLMAPPVNNAAQGTNHSVHEALGTVQTQLTAGASSSWHCPLVLLRVTSLIHREFTTLSS